jgi:hypothetical protein
VFICRGGLFPGVVFYLSMWYKRNEQHYRVALFFSAASLVSNHSSFPPLSCEKLPRESLAVFICREKRTNPSQFPGVVFYLSMWYKRNEQHYRVALFFSAASLAGAFGGQNDMVDRDVLG